MNNLFSWKRFAKLFKKHTVENYKNYLLSVVVVFGILLLFLGFIQFQKTRIMPVDQQVVYFMTFFLLLGSIFTSNVFSDFSINKRAIAALALPASHFEKFLVAWIYSFLIFQIVYVLAFYLVLFLLLKTGSFKNQQIELFSLFDQNQKPYMILAVYAFLHSCTLLGAIVFKKWHFIKTAAVLFALSFLIYSANVQILKSLLGNHINSIPFWGMEYTEDNKYQYISLSAELFPLFDAWYILVTILLWSSSYFRLKEKQV